MTHPVDGAGGGFARFVRIFLKYARGLQLLQSLPLLWGDAGGLWASAICMHRAEFANKAVNLLVSRFRGNGRGRFFEKLLDKLFLVPTCVQRSHDAGSIDQIHARDGIDAESFVESPSQIFFTDY